MKPWLNFIFVLLVIVLGADTPSALAQRTLEWYRETYGALSASDHNLAAKANEVFKRVTSAADKPGNLDPKLLIIDEKQDPWSLCLKDGGIIISLATLKLCYADGPDDPAGSARLAFVLGHEIAHLTKGDFWHANVREFIQGARSTQKGMATYYEFHPDSQDVNKRELKADHFGMIYAFMAGYDPYLIITARDINFFKEWVNRPAGKIAGDAQSYPSPELRAKHLRLTLESICSQINVFELSLRLYQKGDYDQALICLQHVKNIFPCREVFNNLGLIYLQKAIDLLDILHEKRICQFKLATVLDTEVRAARGSKVSADTKTALKATYDNAIAEAIKHFEYACKQDISYLPARVNLASAYIINQDYSNALAILENTKGLKKNHGLKTAAKLNQDEQNVLCNYAVAFYLYGRSKGINADQMAIRTLKSILLSAPDHAGALYNLGRILLSNKRTKEAFNKWRRFLAVESSGRYAGQVEESIGGTTMASTDFQTQFESPPPIEMGYINIKMRKRLATFSRKELNLDSLEGGACHIKGEIKVWELDRFIQCVETPPEKELHIATITAAYGVPARIILSASGQETYVYKEFALDLDQNKQVKKVIYFEYL